MDVNKINLDEFKTIFHYIIDNNKRLVNEGKMPTAIALEADAGIGKTSTILQIACPILPLQPCIIIFIILSPFH